MKQQNFNMPTPQEIHALIEFCKVMANSPFYQKLGPGGVMAIYLTAKEYDLPFMACLNGGLHTFDGKVTFSAIMIDALILKAGHKTEVLKLDNQSCRIRFVRGDRKNDPNYKPFEFEYTVEKAKNAGYLSKKNWQTSLDDMLYSRCLTGGARKHVPEVMVGVLVTGELVGDDRDGNIPPLIPATVSSTMALSTDSFNQSNKIEYQPCEGYEDFISKHHLKEITGQIESRKFEFVKKSAEKSNLPINKVIDFAVKNEEDFLNKFSKWEKENYPENENLHSMDELFEKQSM